MISLDAPDDRPYGRPRAWHRLYIHVTTEHPGSLTDQLRALVQAGHDGADPEDIAAVQAALWAPYSGRAAFAERTNR